MIPYDLDDLRTKVAALKLRLSGLLRAREEALLQFNRQKRLGALSAQEARAKEKQERDLELHRIRTRLAVEQDKAGARHARFVPRIERGYSNAAARVREKLRQNSAKLAEDERRARDAALNELHEKHRAVEGRLIAQQEEAAALLAEAGEIEGDADRLQSHIGGGAGPGAAAAPPQVTASDDVAPRVREKLRALRKETAAIWRDGRFRFIRMTPIVGPILGLATVPGFNYASTWAVGRVFKNHFAKGGTLPNLDMAAAKRQYREMFGSAPSTQTT